MKGPLDQVGSFPGPPMIYPTQSKTKLKILNKIGPHPTFFWQVKMQTKYVLDLNLTLEKDACMQ